MKNEKRAELRIHLANFVIIAARVPHEPDTMLAYIDKFEKWVDDVGDEKVSRAVSPFIKPPTQEEVSEINRTRLNKLT